jgi:hypothetical protein
MVTSTLTRGISKVIRIQPGIFYSARIFILQHQEAL